MTVRQALHAVLNEPPPPLGDGRSRDIEFRLHRPCGNALGEEQHDLGALDESRRQGVRAGDLLEVIALYVGHMNRLSLQRAYTYKTTAGRQTFIKYGPLDGEAAAEGIRPSRSAIDSRPYSARTTPNVAAPSQHPIGVCLPEKSAPPSGTKGTSLRSESYGGQTMSCSEIVKTLVGPVVALIIAVVGAVLTGRYNDTQLRIADQRAHAEIEVTRINAALRYMEVLRGLPADDVSHGRQALAIAAPALPPEIAFRLAVGQLPHDTEVLDILQAKYQDNAHKYLVDSLEVPFHELRRVLSPSSAVESNEERRARNILQHLRSKGQVEHLFRFLVSGEYENAHSRPLALLLYFDTYREFLESSGGGNVGDAYSQVRFEHEFRSLMSNGALSAEAKRAVAFSASIVFGARYVAEDDTFSRHAAEYFWNGFDVIHGQTPDAGTIQGHIFSKVFHYNYPPGTDMWFKRPAAELASESLRKAILALDFRKLDIENIRMILYAYAESRTVADSPSYLMPADAAAVVRVLLDWADTAQRRQELAMGFGSLSGEMLFRNLGPECFGCSDDMAEEELAARCAAARDFGEMLAGWYVKYRADDWDTPGFFHSVVRWFPDLADRIDYEAWSEGARNSEASSDVCRGS